MAAYTTSSFDKKNFSFPRPNWSTNFVYVAKDYGNTSSYDKKNFLFTRPSWSTYFALATLSFSTSSFVTVMGNLRTVQPQIPNKTIYPRTP